jgi:polygalacturonase
MHEVTLKDAGNWTGHFAVCDHVRVHGVKIRSYGAGNSDGIDIDSCREVSISDCDIAAGDDVICLKSTYPQPCQNVVVTNCTLRTYSNALKLGTASVGGFHNITFSNCAIYDALRGGIKVETVDGGDLWNVTFSNITMENVGTPIFIRLGNRGADYGNPGIQKPLPIASLKGVLISNIRARVTKTDGRFWPLVLSNQPDPTRHADIYGCSITGIPGHDVENISLENVSITFAPGGTIEHARRLDVPELEATYPESGMFGVLPAYGFYIRHAKGVTLANMRIDVDGTDMRPAIICDQVEDLELAGLKAAPPSGSEPLLRFRNARNVFVHGSRPLALVETFLLVEGQQSTAIALVANNLRQAKTNVVSAPGVPPGAVQESANVKTI